MKVGGQLRYVYRAVDQFGQVVDVYVSRQLDGVAARRFFDHALGSTAVRPAQVTTDKASVYLWALDELAPQAWHCTERYANNRVEADHGQLKRRLRAMRGLKTDHGARVVVAGHAFVQNVRRGHYELAVDQPVNLRVRPHSTNSPSRSDRAPPAGPTCPAIEQCNGAVFGALTGVSSLAALFLGILLVLSSSLSS